MRFLSCPHCGLGHIANDPDAASPFLYCANCSTLLLEHAPADDLFPERTRLWYKRKAHRQ